MRSLRNVAVAVAALSALTMAAACGAGGNAQAANDTAKNQAATTRKSSDAASGLVGPGCAAYAKAVPTGAGSVQGMGQDPVAVAASNNPLLKTLTAAVSGKLNPKVNLVSTLDSNQFTVFAPVDQAFAKLPRETVRALAEPRNAKSLTSVLTYHVVAGRIGPDRIAGEHTTVQGAKVRVSGSGDHLRVNGATVICGGVRTSTATVYLIDSVLMPPS